MNSCLELHFTDEKALKQVFKQPFLICLKLSSRALVKMDKKLREKLRYFHGISNTDNLPPAPPLPKSPVDATFLYRAPRIVEIEGKIYETAYDYYIRKRDNGEEILITQKAPFLNYIGLVQKIENA